MRTLNRTSTIVTTMACAFAVFFESHTASAATQPTVSLINGDYVLTVPGGKAPYSIELDCTLEDGTTTSVVKYISTEATPKLRVISDAQACSGSVNNLAIVPFAVSSHKVGRVYIVSQSKPDTSILLAMDQLEHAFSANNIDAVTQSSVVYDPSAEDKLCKGYHANDRVFVVHFATAQQYIEYIGTYPTTTDSQARVFRCQGSGDAITATFEWANTADVNIQYVANPFKAVGVTAALLTSPWVNKYRLWLAVPTTILDAFDHHARVTTDLNNCAMNDLVAYYLLNTGYIQTKDDYGTWRCQWDPKKEKRNPKS